ncbi:Hypothetical protein R9X50_00593200 [Acrodontium crateriforme]|uniref:chitinase n=1 Tax=Acrodontium crateriforme TaxID=150365 RepID=A0AAQ3RDE8_9PEZI|nr:Hypothetical protein R9X50_00593200 [Acrodontium crateriforme]
MRVVGFSLIAAFATGALARPALVERAGTQKLVTYVQTFHTTDNQPLSLLPLRDDDSGVTHVNLAALHVNGPGQITLNDNNPNSTFYDQVWEDVEQLQSSGIKVLIMIGGAAQGSYQRLCGSSTPAVIDESMYGPLRDTLRYHNIDGVDLDIEETVDISCAHVLLNRFDQDFGSNFLLTMAPVASNLIPGGPGLSGFDYVQLDSQATSPTRPNGKLVSWYNGQFYNGWGDASSAVNYDSIISSGNWASSRIVLGVLDNSNDGGSGFVSLPTLEQTITNIKTLHGDFGGVVSWEYWDAGGRDNVSNYDWIKNVGDALFRNQIDNKATLIPVLETADTPQAPWPVSQDVLVAAGAEWMQAVWALNTTSGNLDLAAKKLHLDLGEGVL